MSANPKLKIIHRQAYTNSIDLAKHFQKSHDKILRDIRNILSDCPTEF